MAWTLAEMRRLLFDETVPYEWSDALINDVLTEDTNKYSAAAKLCRALATKYGREAYSYRMTDGKAMDKTQRAKELRAMADDFEKQAKSTPADALVLGKFAVADTGEDLTEFEE
jgi:hypothetical protein